MNKSRSKLHPERTTDRKRTADARNETLRRRKIRREKGKAVR